MTSPCLEAYRPRTLAEVAAQLERNLALLRRHEPEACALIALYDRLALLREQMRG